MFDGKAFGQEIVAAVKQHVERAMSPVLARLADLERRLVEPTVGKADIEEVRRGIAGLKAAVDGLPAPQELPDMAKMIADAIAAIPAPMVVEQVKAETIKAMVDEAVTAAVAALPPAKPGRDVDMAAVGELVKAEAERILAGWQRPQDGKSITVEAVAPMIAEAVAKAMATIPAPKDGIGLAGAIIDRKGHLQVTTTDGRPHDLGPVVGADADMDALRRQVAEMVAAIPVPKNGIDGFGFDDLDLVETEAGVVLRFSKEGVVKDFPVPIVVDRGVWKEGRTYAKGNGVTWGGSFWIAQEETADKPDSGKGWRLSVKKGRDGKDFEPKPAQNPGPVKVG